MRFLCRPWAYVHFQGRNLGQTPRSRRLGPGRYRVRFENPVLGVTRRRSFRVRGGQTVTVRCGLQALYREKRERSR